MGSDSLSASAELTHSARRLPPAFTPAALTTDITSLTSDITTAVQPHCILRSITATFV